MKESRVWAWINSHKESVQTHVFERVEVLTPPGMSDCMVTNMNNGATSWLELKLCVHTDSQFKRGFIPKLRPSQPMFLRARASLGVKGAILLRTGENPRFAEWRLWQADDSREWVKFVGGNTAIANPTQLWKGMPTLNEIVAYL